MEVARITQLEERSGLHREALIEAMPRRDINFALLSFVMDMLITLVALVAASAVTGIALTAEVPALALPLKVVVFMSIWSGTFMLTSLYDLSSSYKYKEEARRVAYSVTLATLAFIAVCYMLEVTVARELILAHVGISLGLLLGWRAFAYYLAAARWAFAPSNVLVIGTSEHGRQMHDIVRRIRSLNMAGFVGDGTLESFANAPVIATMDENIYQVIREHKIDHIVVAQPARNNDPFNQLMDRLQYAPIPVHMIPNYLDLSLYRARANRLNDLPLVRMSKAAMNNRQILLKRVFDILVASAITLAVLPVMIFVAIAIKLDTPGPALFLQDRMGQNGHKFKIYKFRSMVKDADSLHKEASIVDEDGTTIHKTKNDFRVTRVGKFIRKTSLDELPQLLNVIKGDMSLVGPRPELIRLVDEYEPWQNERFVVPQGITGWWQVNGRSDKACHLSTDKDIHYIRNYSLWMDIKILLMTLPAVMRGKGAF